MDGLGCSDHALEPCRFDPSEPRCSGCAGRLAAGLGSGLCADCRRRSRGYLRLCAVGAYRQPSALREWILAFKHGGRRELATPLAALLASAWSGSTGASPGVVLVSVPLHPLRRFERGYDQARLLCDELARELDFPHVPALRRTRWTPPQGAPGASSRRANVQGAFALVGRRARHLAGRALLLVDDVVTSGATVRACAEVLRGARPTEVSVLCLARAERSGEASAAESKDERDPAEP
ncbi:MAG: ComF family protein [Planctomycetes bacterium]|nr:ComF family protein [Planctomycetota bacterium]